LRPTPFGLQVPLQTVTPIERRIGNTKQTTFAYDPLNRPTFINYPAPDADVSLAYDVVGQRTTMTDTFGATTWAYDQLGRPLTITQPTIGAVGYGYDSASNRATLKYPDGKVVTYTYDVASRLVQVKDWQGQIVTYTYNANSALTGSGLPNGVLGAMTYDAADHLTAITYTRNAQTAAAYLYTYNQAGNRTNAVETLRQPSGSNPASVTTALTYTYDSLYRLTNAAYGTANVFTYTYDAVGNALVHTRTVSGQTISTTYTYNNANQLVTAKASNDATTWYYTFDAKGYLTSITPNGTSPGNGARRYTYSVAGYLTKAELHDGSAYQPQADMKYDGLGNRRVMTGWSGGVSATTTYTVDLLLPVAPPLVAAPNSGQATFYLYGSNGPIADATSTLAYYLKDGTRSVRQLTSSAGAITLARTFTPWGEVLSQNGTGNVV